MQSKRTRLDRFISLELGVNRRDVKQIVAQGRLQVDGEVVSDSQRVIDAFSRVTLDDQVLRSNRPVYIMMNKPIGVVSATKDAEHKTVIDLLHEPEQKTLHIAGRLDMNSTGLLLLTNDGTWSRALSDPKSKVEKRYRVTLERPLTEDYIHAFSEGMYFGYEDITTQPAGLIIIEENVAEVCLTEGRYHQIKRMFGRFRNPVLKLHRIAIGNLRLDQTLESGQHRLLSSLEIENI